MSSTSNVQDLLVNVFRPTYRWQSGTGFVPSVTLSNINELIASKIKTDSLVVSDSNVNTYIGSNAGVNAINTASNVALGWSAMGGALNARENVAIGAFALEGLSNSDCNVAIGSRADITGQGARNVLIGPGVTIGDGSGNIIIGVDLSMGNVSGKFRLGNLLYGDLSFGFFGINTSDPQAAFDISGVTVFRNKVGFQNPTPAFSLDVNGDIYTNGTFIGGDGTVANPLYTFSNSRTSGMYVPIPSTTVGTVDLSTVGTGAFGIATNGQPAAIFTTTKTHFMKDLDVSGTFTARSVNLGGFAVSNGTANQPSVTFTSDTSTGLFLAASNVLGVSTGGVRRIAVLSNGDVSMGQLLASDISLSGAIFSSSGSNSIGGVTLSNGFVITTGTTTSSNLLVPGYLRNALTPTTLDISGGNISNSGTMQSSNIRVSDGAVSTPTYSFASDASTGFYRAGANEVRYATLGIDRVFFTSTQLGVGVTPSVSLDVSGTIRGRNGLVSDTYIRDAVTPSTLDISGGNISNSGTTTSTNALVSGYLRNALTPSTLDISGGNISNSGVHTTAGLVGSYLRNALTPTTLDISSGNISNSGVHTTAGLVGTYLRNALTPTTYDISGGNISNSGTTTSTNALVSGYLRNALTPTTYDISGGNISNSGTTRSSNFIGTSSAASNNIGGVVLSNSNVVTGNGTVAAPAISVGDLSSGLYRANANSIGVSVLGVKTANFRENLIEFSNAGSATLLLSNNQVRAIDGTVSAPIYSFALDTCTGFYRVGSSEIGYTTGGVQRMSFSNSVLSIARTTLTDTSLMIQLPTNGYLAAGRLYLGDPSNSTTASGGTIVEGLSNGGSGACDLLLYSRQSGAGSTAPRERIRVVGTTGSVGIGTSNPAYTLDVCGTDATASVNAATWMRSGGSNVLVVRSVSNIIGNTVVWGTATQAIDSALATYRRNPAPGNFGTSIVILRSGMWAISAYSVHSTGTIPFWIDCSTSDISTVPFNSAGNQTLAIIPGVGTQQSLAWCGYLPSNSNVYYKFRSNGVIADSNTWHLQLAFLGESGLSITFPQ